MDALYPICCGMDIHKNGVVACLYSHSPNGKAQKELRKFGTTTRELLALADWLLDRGCQHVAMESTGIYWRPIYNILETQFELLVVNTHYLKMVPGRKTDQRDAEWIAELLSYGLLKASYIPSREQREWRDLMRYRRTLVEDRTRLMNRLQKVLEDANIKLGDVVSDLQGVSAQAMLQALTQGQTDAQQLADLARGSLRGKTEALQAALEGSFNAHHRFMLTAYLDHWHYLNQAIEQVSSEIDVRLKALTSELELLDTIPGVNQRTAQILLAEIGAEMTRFPSAKHLASWAGICPGNNESAGKQWNGHTRKGNKYLRQALLEAAHGAVNTKKGYLYAQYRRLSARRGKKRALVAVAHSILVMLFYILKRRVPYHELGDNYFDERDRKNVERRAVQRLEQLGFQVSLVPAASSV